jgi:ADP-ribose pyrophosphatase
MKSTHHPRVLSSRSIYQGRILQLRVDRVEEPGGVVAEREVVEHQGSVVVLPILPDGRVLLVEQYRHAVRRSLWELVAGGIEKGETPRRAAARELQEETGYRAATLKTLFDFYPSPGVMSERMFLVEARGLRPAPSCPEPDEVITVGSFSLTQLRTMIRQNKIRDGKTFVGLLWHFGRKKSGIQPA